MHDVSILLQIVLVAVFSYRRSLDPRYDDDDDDSICNYVQLLYNRIIDNGYFFTGSTVRSVSAGILIYSNYSGVASLRFSRKGDTPYRLGENWRGGVLPI